MYCTVIRCRCDVLESKQPVEELKSYGRLGPQSIMFNYSGCAGIIIVEADRLGVGYVYCIQVIGLCNLMCSIYLF